ERHLRVQFSQSLRSIAAVKPAEFRLSLATTDPPCKDERACSRLSARDKLSTIYEDVGAYGGDGKPNPFVAIVADDAPDVLILELASAITPKDCELAAGFGPVGGLFLHYGNTDIGGPVENPQGIDLARFGDTAWVGASSEPTLTTAGFFSYPYPLSI